MHVHFAYVAWLEISVTGVVQEQLADRVYVYIYIYIYIYIFNKYTYVYISMENSDNKKEVAVNLKKTVVYVGLKMVKVKMFGINAKNNSHISW